MELLWNASATASVLYDASAVSAGKPDVPQIVVDTLATSVAVLDRRLLECGVTPAEAYARWCPLAVGIHMADELVSVALAKLLPHDRAQLVKPRLTGPLAELLRAGRHVAPELLDELELRSGPLREQWESRGPGLLAAIARLTERGLLVEQATIGLVQPLGAGGGCAYLAYNTVLFEAVLANSVPQLPEVLRLGWLLATLNHDLPAYADSVGPKRAAELAPLALMPVALAAGQEIELAPYSRALLENALTHWRVPGEAGALADTLDRWWQTYQDSQPTWPVALKALDAMLTGAPANTGDSAPADEPTDS